jgi:hypothetical protein
MKKIIKPRRAGKSTELIRMSEESGAYIIVSSRARANFLFQLAHETGHKIPFPVTYREYEQSRFRGSFVRHVLIDDADDLLEHLFREVTIDAITMTEDQEGESNHEKHTCGSEQSSV